MSHLMLHMAIFRVILYHKITENIQIMIYQGYFEAKIVKNEWKSQISGEYFSKLIVLIDVTFNDAYGYI